MKHRQTFTLLLSLIFASVVPEALGDHPFDVTVLYLVQDKDRGDEDIPGARKAFEQARQLITDEMERHGHGEGRGFNYDEENGFRVHYEKNKDVNFFENSSINEIYQWAMGWMPGWWDRENKLNREEEMNRVYLVLIEGARSVTNRRDCAIGGITFVTGFPPQRYMHSGVAFVPMQQKCADMSMIIAHELCHAFGLHHSTQSGKYLMSRRAQGGTRLLEEESNWLAGTRYFNPSRKPISGGVGVRLNHMRSVDKDGLRFVRSVYNINASKGAYMLQLWQPGLGMHAIVELDTWADFAVVDIPWNTIREEQNLYWWALSATGALTGANHPVDIMLNVDPKEGFSVPLSWAEIKTQRQ